MAGLTWFELDVDMPADPKCAALGVRLRNPLAFGYVVRLYAYCYRFALDRFVGSGGQATIEAACGWRGKAGVLVAALVAEKFLEPGGEALVVHGVAARLTPHLAARRHAAERQKRRRDKAAESLARHLSVGRDVTRDARVSHTDDSNRDLNTSSLRSEGAPPAASPAEPGSAAGGGEQPDPPPASPPPAPKSDFALAVEHWFTAWERAGRGKHARLTEAEGKQLKALLAELGLAELTARMGRALADPWFLEHGDLLAFVKQRNKFARRGAPAVVDERTKRLEAAVARSRGSCPEWAAMLQAAARGLDRGGLDREVVDRVLVDVVPERRGQVLELRARDGFHANALADRWFDWLVAGARAVSGEALHVQVIGPQSAAGGEA
jgi:hypothetical protein